MKNIAILVVSCDKYSDLWDIFFSYINKNWAECDISVYLGTNYKCYNSDKVKTIQIGEDRSWADNVKKMLEEVNEDYVLMLLEDFFICDQVRNTEIEKYYDFLLEKRADFIRLNPCPPPHNTINPKLKIGEIEEGEPYYISTQPAIWKKTALLGLLKSGYSAWDFEIKNSENSKDLNIKGLGTNKYVIKHLNGVERGKYYLSTINNINKSFSKVEFSEQRLPAINDTTFNRKVRLKIYRIKLWLYIKTHIYRYKKIQF